MNWLDKAIAYMAPGAGARRAQARAAIEVWRTYEGAKNTRRTENWKAPGTSPNAALSSSLANLRNRSRQMVRDNPHASRALSSLRAKCVGTGITARVEPTVKKAWTHFWKNCDVEGDLDFGGVQSLVAGTQFEAGEVLVRRIRTADPRSPLKLQILEPDYIDSAKFEAFGDNFIIAGVEIDRLGRRQAMWLFDQHPGELTTPWHRNYKSQRVPMTELIHFYEKLRPGQLRGASRFASSLIRARDLDEYREALLVKRKIEACFAAFVVGGNPSLPLAETTTDATTGKRTETLSPGMIEYVPAGQDVKFANPSSSSGESEYTRDELRAFAAGVGCTYEQLTGDLSQVNFSSIRAGEINLREIVEAWRWVYFIPMFCERVYGWFEDAYWTAGQIRTTEYEVVWSPPRWQYVDPQKDVEAMKAEVRGGFQSLSAKIRELGYDPDEVFAEIEEERRTLREKKIVVDTDASVKSAGGAPAKEGAGGNDGEDGQDGAGEKVEKQDEERLLEVLRGARGDLGAAIRSLAQAVPAVDGRELAAAVDGLRAGQAAIAATLRESSGVLERLGDRLAYLHARAGEHGTQLERVAGVLNETSRATTEGMARISNEIAKPSAPVFNAKGELVGVRKVDKLQD